MNLEFEEGFELITFALKEKNKELLFLRWTINYEDQMSFEEFEKNLSVNSIEDNSSEEEILNKVKNILSMNGGEI